IETLNRSPVALVEDSVERVYCGHAGPAGGDAPVEPCAFTVGVDDLDPELPYQADGREQRAGSGSTGRDLHGREAEGAKALEEGTVARPRHGHLELAPRQATGQVVPRPWP